MRTSGPEEGSPADQIRDEMKATGHTARRAKQTLEARGARGAILRSPRRIEGAARDEGSELAARNPETTVRVTEHTWRSPGVIRRRQAIDWRC